MRKNRKDHTADSGGDDFSLEKGRKDNYKSRIFNVGKEKQSRMRKFVVPIYMYSQ